MAPFCGELASIRGDHLLRVIQGPYRKQTLETIIHIDDGSVCAFRQGSSHHGRRGQVSGFRRGTQHPQGFFACTQADEPVFPAREHLAQREPLLSRMPVKIMKPYSPIRTTPQSRRGLIASVSRKRTLKCFADGLAFDATTRQHSHRETGIAIKSPQYGRGIQFVFRQLRFIPAGVTVM